MGQKNNFICTAERSADNLVSLSESVGSEAGETTVRTHKQSSCCGAAGSKGLWELWDFWASKQVDETHLIHWSGNRGVNWLGPPQAPSEYLRTQGALLHLQNSSVVSAVEENDGNKFLVNKQLAATAACHRVARATCSASVWVSCCIWRTV